MNKRSGLSSAGAVALALALTAFVSPDTASAAAYMKLGDIKGESAAAAPRGEIEILSWSWGEASAPSGRRQHKPLTITKPVDKASPILQQASTSGGSIPMLELALPKEGGGAEEYVKYRLENVRVTSYSVSGSGTAGRSRPVESFSLNYEKISTVPARIVQRNASDVDFVVERARRQ
jgi:type VI secretion system secreted protein Hcp